MTKKELKANFDLNGFFELFQMLEKGGHTKRESIVLNRPIGSNEEPAKEWKLKLADIKAQAFDELYARLPLKSSLLVIMEMAGENATIAQAETVQHLQTLLEKIPTRYK